MNITSEYILGVLPEVLLAIGIVTILGYGVLIRGGRVSLLVTVSDLSVLILIGTMITEWAVSSHSTEASQALIKMVIIGGGVIVLMISREESQIEEQEWKIVNIIR